jgi:hypothetical protein
MRFIPAKWWREKISLSERFGLWVSFTRSRGVPDHHGTDSIGVFRRDGRGHFQARPAALVWALERGSRSGRISSARDYAASRLTPECCGRRADGRRDRPREGGTDRKIVDVAVVLIRVWRSVSAHVPPNLAKPAKRYRVPASYR